MECYQLLDARLFPATFSRPQTAFSFDLLDCLSSLSMRGKVSAYDYYITLRCLTDTCELRGIPKRYDELNVAIRCYRNLLAYKRAGVGHNANGISDLQSGDLAVECPASPLPGKNLPEDWEIKFALKPHLRAQYLAIDANFRLKRKDRGLSGIESLTGNGGYFVDQDLFNQELKRSQENREAKETSTCDSSFAAIERANSRYNRGYSVTGVVAAIDSRHGFVLPNAVADLQKGERYFNSDFVFLSSLCKQGLNLAFVSYNIVCQWQRNLMDRCTRFESPLRSHLSSLELVYAIPKFHLPAHGFKCWSRFSLNFIPGSARVDGEAIERLWARTNPVATSTREMKASVRATLGRRGHRYTTQH